MIAINEWVVTREQEPSDLVPEPGRVIRTAPQAGEELAEGEPFLIVVSEGPIPRELPDSTGALFSEAQTRLVERDLVVLPAEQFHELVPEGIVIGWSVPGDLTLVAGSFVPPGTSVELVISMGPAPREIPDVVGRTVGDARSELESIQLTLSEDEQQFSDDVALGSIIWQSIDPGTEVERGSNLVVVVSKGPDLVIFPDISTAATFDDAAAQLIEAGFVPQLTFGDAQGAIRSYEIDGRTPEIGETFRRGTRVDIEAL